MGVIPIKDIFYLVVILAVFVGMAWWHHDAVLEGEAKCQAQQREAIAQQHIKDAQASQDAIDELNQDKARLEAQLDSKPPPTVHTCGRLYYTDRPLRPSPNTTRVQPGEPAEPVADSRVPAGSGGGDVGPGVRAIAAAGQLDALYYARLYEWTLKTR